MAHSIDELLGSGTLSEEVRSSISEAWETKQAELREEVAQNYVKNLQDVMKMTKRKL